MSETRQDPERIYLEPPPYSPEGRQWCADDVWPLDGDGPGGVEYVRADLATPEPGGEGGTLESRAYDIAHWIAMEARVAESLGRSVAPIESEGARRIVALASARPTPAASEDVRERVVDEIVSTFRTLYPHARGLVAPAAYAAADRIIALLRTPRGEGEVKEMSRTVVVDWTKLEGVLRRQMGFAIEMAARYYPKIHEPDNPDDESRQQWVRWLVAYAMNAVTECRTLRSEAQGEGWQVTEPTRDIVRREMPETRATVREAIRAARRGEGGE